MGNNVTATRETQHQYIPKGKAPMVLVTYRPDGDDSFTYSGEHKAYTNDPSSLAGIPGPRPPDTDPIVDDVLTVGNTDVNKLDVSDAVAILLRNQTSETTKVRILWNWLTSQNIHGTNYKLTEDFDEVEYHFQKLKKTGRSDGNTYAALFSLLCAYAKIPCVLIRGYVKGSLYNIGQNITSKHMAEWNAVYMGGSWRLLDPFWGACCKTPDGETISDAAGWYFFTEPRHFLYSHFPETTEWQLVDQPITLQDFSHQPGLTDRFFRLGLRDSVTPSSNTVSTNDGQVNILIPLDSDRAKRQEFKCILKRKDSENSWIETTPEKSYNQYDFMFEMKDGDMVTLSIYVRALTAGTYKVEIIGKESNDSSSELNDFDWLTIYRVEVRNLQRQVYLFPEKPRIAWGPGDKRKEMGIEAVSHQEGMIMFFPDDQLQMEFKVRGESKHKNLRLRGKLHMKNGEVLPERRRVTDEDWFSKENDRSIKFMVRLDVAAEYMLQICAEVDGRDIGSVCNYLIICVGEIIDNVLEEIKKLKPRIKTAMNRKNLYDLRRLTNQTRAKALHRHPQMYEFYNEAMSALRSLEAREDILRKLKALKIPHIVREIRGYKQVPDVKVEQVMKATFILLGVNEKELKPPSIFCDCTARFVSDLVGTQIVGFPTHMLILQTWDAIRQRLLSADASEGLAGKIQRLRDTMNDFITDRRNRAIIARVDYILKGIESEDLERVSLAVLALYEVIKLIVVEYKTANPSQTGRRSTVNDGDSRISPITSGGRGTQREEPITEESATASRSDDLRSAENASPEPNHSDHTNANNIQHGTDNGNINDGPQAEVHTQSDTEGQRDAGATAQSKMIPIIPRVEL